MVTDGDEDDDELGEGVVWLLNVSQNAPPNFLNRVCPASAALCSLGEPGGVGRPLYDEYGLDHIAECFPDKSAESAE